MIAMIFGSKGGGGKSTTCAQLAAEIANRQRKLVVIDADPLGTTRSWGLYRSENKDLPRITVLTLPPEEIPKSLPKLQKEYDDIIVDLQGGDSTAKRKVLLEADKVIVPCKPTQPDLDHIPYISKMMDQLKKQRPKIEVYYVFNEAAYSPAKVKPVDESRLYLKAFGVKPLDTVIYRRNAYLKSMEQGRGACELKDAKAKAEIEGVFREIYGTVKAGVKHADRRLRAGEPHADSMLN